MQSPQRILDDEDESVRIAVTALGDMRNSRSSVYTSFYPSPALSSRPTTSGSPMSMTSIQDISSPDLFARVSTIPIVNTALRAYEQSKASSRVVKYGAEMMESSVKTISRPVIDRLPVNQLDEFACRQLDRLGKYGSPRSPSRDGAPQTDERMPSPPPDRGRRPSVEKDRSARKSTSRTPTPGEHSTVDEPNQQQAVAQRSRWQAVLLEAGGLGAAVSEESMRKLKYCLQWLMYATAHIDTQILILRDFMASLQNPSLQDHSANLVSPQHMRTLNDVKSDVIETIRQVVDIVSKYAGGALPEPAKARVRGFILHLPRKWATASRQTNNETSMPAQSASTSRRGGRNPYPTIAEGSSHHLHSNVKTVSRHTSPASSRSASVASNGRAPYHGHSRHNSSSAVSAGVPVSIANQAAHRILTLAAESLDMLRGVTGVFKESLDRADAWVERLKVVGIQRQQESPLEPSDSSSSRFDGVSRPPSPSYLASRDSSRPSLSRSSSEFYSSSPPSPSSPEAALDSLSITSTGRGIVIESSKDNRGGEDNEEGEERGGINEKECGIDVQSWARSRMVTEHDIDDGVVKMDTDV